MVPVRRLMTVAPLLAGLMLGVSAVLALHACASESDVSASASTVAASPQDAIAQVVQSGGDRYAGLCEQTRSPEDVGKVCSKLADSRGDVQAHMIGRTFSEFSTWVFVAERDGGFAVVATAPLDFHDMTGTIPWPQ